MPARTGIQQSLPEYDSDGLKHVKVHLHTGPQQRRVGYGGPVPDNHERLWGRKGGGGWWGRDEKGQGRYSVAMLGRVLAACCEDRRRPRLQVLGRKAYCLSGNDGRRLRVCCVTANSREATSCSPTQGSQELQFASNPGRYSLSSSVLQQMTGASIHSRLHPPYTDHPNVRTS